MSHCRSWPQCSEHGCCSLQVVHVYNEMRKVLPQVMETYYAYPEPITAGGSSRKEASPAGKLAKDIEVSKACKLPLIEMHIPYT